MIEPLYEGAGYLTWPHSLPEPVDVCDCNAFEAVDTEGLCVCGHDADEHSPDGECLAGVLE